MSIFDRFRKQNSRQANKQATDNTTQEFMRVLTQFFSNNYNTSKNDNLLRNNTQLLQAVDLIATSIQRLDGYFHDENNKEKYEDIKNLIYFPNERESKFTFWYGVVKDYFDGDAFIQVVHGRTKDYLVRLNRDKVTIKEGDLNIEYLQNDGTTTFIQYEDLIHIVSRFHYNGVFGDSIYNEIREQLQQYESLKDFVKNFYSMNTLLNGRLVINLNDLNSLNDDKRKQIQKDFINAYSGSSNSTKPLIQEYGIDYKMLESAYSNVSSWTTSLKDILLESQEEISEAFHVPLSMLQGNITNAETTWAQFMEGAIKPIGEEIAQRLVMTLIPEKDRQKVTWEWKYNALEKIELTKRIQAEVSQVNNGLLSRNEVRDENGRNAIDDEAGDYFTINTAASIPLKQDYLTSLYNKTNTEQQGVKLNNNLPSDSSSDEFHKEMPDGFNDALTGDKQ